MMVRSASTSDIAPIMALLHQINSEHHAALPSVFSEPERNESAFWLKRITDDESLFLVAERDGAIVGMITAAIRINSEIPFLKKKSVCRISSIVVDERYRRQGIGERLMKEAEKWAVQCEAEEIRLEVMAFNQHAQAFYAGSGYETQSHTMSKDIS